MVMRRLTFSGLLGTKLEAFYGVKIEFDITIYRSCVERIKVGRNYYQTSYLDSDPREDGGYAAI